MTRSTPPARLTGPTWYQDAIIYEVRTRSFFDSDGDGIGDFDGLTSKLGYLQDLGVTALWLLPFYPSPGRDDGYDISDYTGVHPDVGTVEDFERFVEEAHRRGIRVITELVLNHTSDQHPWFQRARRAKPGSPERDFNVWAESPDRYRDARIIFKDFEVSNWSWDREANAYYWHRFYAHQPDLNFENPAVHEALLKAVDFWFSKGVDGLRLDAVPYLFEEEGTNCENLPRTHAFLKKLRAHVDAKFADRMLLAEANQWPEDAAAYFGNGDECHMNFHFPLMPRMFMAIHQEDRFPIIDIFAQTPEIPPTCQWALFLRNHDELTLEMVTDEERDYMYRAYADQAAMRINLGIRRRLAPLVGNARRKMELLSGLLLSLRGTPVLYYGDEIGMGDNVYLGDRNGVRTPMQWSMDRNAGFSHANPQRLILPVVIDPEYHYQSLNVENQQQNPTSLLWWTKRLIALRKRFTAFGRGTIEFLAPANPRVLAFVRQHEAQRVLVVANLSRFTQYVELDLAAHKGAAPVELFGKTRFPPVGDTPYMLTLGPHSFYWFSLEAPRAADARVSLMPTAVIETSSLDDLLFGEERARLVEVLPAFLETRPWYSGNLQTLRAVQVVDVARIESAAQPLFVVLARVEYSDAASELYVLPIAWVSGDAPVSPASTVALVVAGTEKGALVDALDDPQAIHAFFAAFAEHAPDSREASRVVATTFGDRDLSPIDLATEARKLGRQRDHSTVRLGEHLVFKLARRVDEGVSAEVEVGKFLATQASDLVPRLWGTLEWHRPRAEPLTLGVLHTFVPNVGTGWDFALTELGRYYERVLARNPDEPAPAPPTESPLLLAGREPPELVSQMIGAYRDTAARLGERIAQLHLALASNDADPAFAQEPYSTLDLRSKYQSLRNLSGRVLRALRERKPTLSERGQREASAILAREADVVRSFEPLLRAKTSLPRMRVHGDLHLGHVLYTGKDFVLTDLGNFHAHTAAERRRKRSPLRDLAWMVRSFEFAAFKVLLDAAKVRESDLEVARPWALHWTSWTSASFLDGYLKATAGASFVRGSREASTVLFDAFLIERTLYQLHAALEEGAASVTIPLLEIGRLLG